MHGAAQLDAEVLRAASCQRQRQRQQRLLQGAVECFRCG
jgi:hypothetical protein